MSADGKPNGNGHATDYDYKLRSVEFRLGLLEKEAEDRRSSVDGRLKRLVELAESTRSDVIELREFVVRLFDNIEKRVVALEAKPRRGKKK